MGYFELSVRSGEGHEVANLHEGGPCWSDIVAPDSLNVTLGALIIGIGLGDIFYKEPPK